MFKKIKMFVPVVLVILVAVGFWVQVKMQTPHSMENVTEEAEAQDDLIALSQDQRENAGLLIQEAGPGKLELGISLTGRIAMNPESYAHITVNAPGTVKQAHKNVGDRVEKGELLALIESKEVAIAKSDYIATTRKEKLAKNFLNKEKQLYEKKIGAEQEYLEALAEYEDVLLQTELAIQRLYSLGFTESQIKAIPEQLTEDLRLYEMRAPFEGTVIFRHMTQGEHVDLGEEVYVIADLSTVRVEIGLYPKDLKRIKEGDSLLISNDLEETSEAKIVMISPIVDPDTSRVTLVGRVDNSHGQWRPGTYVTAQLKGNDFTAPIVVPIDAVIKIGNQNILFVQQEDKFEKREVVLGKADKHSVEIQSGLKAGESFVAKNAFILKFELTKGEPE